MKYEEAKKIADEVRMALAPHCWRIEIAGSIRRKRPEVGDVEIVAIPKPYGTGLFESGIATVVNRWEKVKGELPCKYTQRMLPQGIKLDLFFATARNWGMIMAVRTGSADFSHKVLARRWSALGYSSSGGELYKDGIAYPIYEEMDLFRFLGIEWVRPEEREV